MRREDTGARSRPRLGRCDVAISRPDTTVADVKLVGSAHRDRRIGPTAPSATGRRRPSTPNPAPVTIVTATRMRVTSSPASTTFPASGTATMLGLRVAPRDGVSASTIDRRFDMLDVRDRVLVGVRRVKVDRRWWLVGRRLHLTMDAPRATADHDEPRRHRSSAVRRRWRRLMPSRIARTFALSLSIVRTRSKTSRAAALVGDEKLLAAPRQVIDEPLLERLLVRRPAP